MRVWGKAPANLKDTTTVARAAVDGQPRQELLKQAVTSLLASGHADRVGVWLEPAGEAFGNSTQIMVFRGVVAEKEGDPVPAAWCKLSPHPPLPSELLTGLRSIQQEFSESPGHPMIGALVEMRRVLWTPVKTHGHLGGVVFAGSRNKKAYLNQTLLESVAAELALAVELEDARSLNRHRQEESRRVLAALVELESPSEALATIVNDCTQEDGRQNGPKAVFAAIGCHVDLLEGRSASLRSLADSIRFAWGSGNASWIRALESEPLRSVWQQALESHRVVGSDSGTASPTPDVGRLVALPLEAGGETLGILIVGLRPGSASLAALESLELCAALAASALLQQKRRRDATQQEIRQNAIVAAADIATIEIRADATIETLNDRARILLRNGPPASVQMPPLAGIPRNFAELFSVTDAQRVKGWLQTVLGAPQSVPAAQEILLDAQLHNGSRVRLQLLFPAADGGAGILLKSLPELADHPHSQNSLSEVLNVIEWLEEGIVLFGAHEEIRAVNTRFGQMIGLSAGEFAGLKTLHDLASALAARAPDPGAFADSAFTFPRKGDGALREELQLLRPVPRLLERAARPIIDRAGTFLGRVEIYRDLTAQRVFQSKLLQTDKLAQLGQMVTAIAHELSNPLTSILGYAQRMLLRRNSIADSQEVRQIFQEAERASAILRQLLLSARDSRPERRRVALNQVISSTLELQRFSLAADNVRVQLDLEPVLPFVQGDAGQLQQVLTNLIGNARQALEEQGKGGTIFVKTKRIAEKRVLLEVRDDGPGIPQSIQARIFDPFFTTKPAGVGTGLGLAIVLGIVREHGGRLHLVSDPGRGTAFSIELPALGALEMESLPSVPALAVRPRVDSVHAPEPIEIVHAGTTLGPWAGTRVLVLEDEPTVARLIADVLEDDGLLVDVLLDSREALQRAACEEYALVICDMRMPELDGEHFYRALASAGNPLHERFLFVTGDVLAAHTRDFLERNHLPHVAKPFRVEELTEKIRSLLVAGSPPEPALPLEAKKNAARK